MASNFKYRTDNMFAGTGADLPLFSGTAQTSRIRYPRRSDREGPGVCPLCQGSREIQGVQCSCYTMRPLEMPELITVEDVNGDQFLVRQRDFDRGNGMPIYVNTGTMFLDMFDLDNVFCVLHPENVAGVVAKVEQDGRSN